ncbi:hypothetical protein [Novilysobacter spongiicola]|nr:hypothetical protein [Lysobacter spongiicola]
MTRLNFLEQWMLDFPDEFARPVARLALTVLRFIWWLTWELWLGVVTWYVGWPVCRAVSLGHFPAAGLHEGDEVDGMPALVVHAAGVLVLVGAIFLLGKYV